jgi:hypothetical protein
LLKGTKSFYSLFRGITCGVLQYLPHVPRLAVRRIAVPRLRFAYLGLLKYRLSEVSEIMSILTEKRCCDEVARRLAIFAVKKLRRFEREETRTV